MASFFTQDRYGKSIVTEAHLRPAIGVEQPSISRHLAFWPDQDFDFQNVSTEAEGAYLRRFWIAKLNKLALALQTPAFWDEPPVWIDLFKDTVTATKDGEPVGIDAPLHGLALDGPWERYAGDKTKLHRASFGFRTTDWRGFEMAAQFTRQTEYATLTITLTPKESPLFGFATETKKRLDMLAGVARGEATLEVDQAASEADALFDQVWTQFDGDIAKAYRHETAPAAPIQLVEDADKAALQYWTKHNSFDEDEKPHRKKTKKPEERASIADERRDAPPGYVFTDLRGASLLISDAPATDAPRPFAGFATVEEPKSTLDGPEIEQPRKYLDRLKTFIDRGVAENSGTSERELVANMMLGGRAIYVSPLAAPLREPSKPAELGAPESAERLAKVDRETQEATRFLIVFGDRPTKSQAGRLLERLHAVETLRSAALRDLHAIRSASDELRHTSADLDQLEQAFVVHKIEAGGGDDFVQELERIQEKISSAGSTAIGGLGYRVSRATIYIESFKRRLTEFRPRVVEGWQPYHEFVDRRLTQTFNTILSVGDRRIDLQQRVRGQILISQSRSAASSAEQLVALTTSLEKLAEQNRTANALASAALTRTDLLSYIVVIAATATLGAQIAPDLAFLSAEMSNLLSGALVGAIGGAAFGGLVVWAIYSRRNHLDRRDGLVTVRANQKRRLKELAEELKNEEEQRRRERR